MIIPDVHDAGTFDSELRTTMMNRITNAELTLVLKVNLQQATGSGGTINDADGTAFTLVPWTTRAWNHFREVYRLSSISFWSGHFWLKTPHDNSELNWPSAHATHRCNVWCRFRLELVVSGGHRTIQVANIRPPRGGGNAGTFRSYDTLYDDFDLGVAVYHRGAHHVYYQRTFVHEVGHALGLPHIAQMTGNAACPAANTNADACYGTVPSEREDVMGFGHHLSLHDARPWMTRIYSHFRDTSGFIGPPSSFDPSKRREYPVRLAPVGVH